MCRGRGRYTHRVCTLPSHHCGFISFLFFVFNQFRFFLWLSLLTCNGLFYSTLQLWLFSIVLHVAVFPNIFYFHLNLSFSSLLAPFLYFSLSLISVLSLSGYFPPLSHISLSHFSLSSVSVPSLSRSRSSSRVSGPFPIFLSHVFQLQNFTWLSFHFPYFSLTCFSFRLPYFSLPCLSFRFPYFSLTCLSFHFHISLSHV